MEANVERDIFLAALEIADAAERAAFLEQACTGDAQLQRRVAALLQTHEQPDSLLDLPVTQTSADADPAAGNAAFSHDGTQAEAASQDFLPFLAPPTEPGALGRLDYYEVLEVAGRGGMGIVFKARDTKLQRIVALKVLAPSLLPSLLARQRFAREARAAAAVRDDHVVAIYAVSDEGAIPYLVMEFINGVTLHDKIKDTGPLKVKEILRIGMQAARGLAAAHAQGLIHRDIKPQNILLENGVQRVKITDFGLARAVEEHETLTQAGLIAGTPLYMAPEQTRGDPVDHRTDLFSLGSVLYTLCTGSPAFRAGSSMAVLLRIRDEAPRLIRDCNPAIPDWLCAIVDKLQAKDPAQRFQSAREVAQLLEQHLARLQLPNPPAEPLDGYRAPIPAPKPHRTRRAAALAAAVVSVVVLTLAVYLLLPSGEPRLTRPVVPVLPEPPVKAVSWFEPLAKGVLVDKGRALREILDFKEIVGATGDELRQWHLDSEPDYRLALLSSRLGEGPFLFNAVAVKEKLPLANRFTYQVPIPEGQRTFDEMGKDGYRPISGCYHNVPDRTVRALESYVWVNDRVGFRAGVHQLPALRTELDRAKSEGVTRLFELAVIGEREDSAFATCEVDEPGRRWSVLYSLTESELLESVASLQRKGWRPDLLQPHEATGELRFILVAVANPDQVAWHLRLDMTLDQYRTESAAQKQRGLMPLCQRSYGADDAVRYAAIWVRYRL